MAILSVHGHRREFADATKALVVVFIGLVITSISYAVLAGEAGEHARTVVEEALVGTTFAICAVQLIYAVALTFRAAGDALSKDRNVYHDVARHLMAITVLLLCPLVIEYITVAAQDYNAVHGHTDVINIGHVLALAALIISISTWIFRPKLAKFKTHRWSDWSYTITLVVVIVPLAANAIVVDSLGACTAPSPGYMIAILLFIFSAMLMAIVNFAIAAPPRPERIARDT